MLQIPELLAPAGDAERLRYAINYGADAVYCGLPEFGMRSAPANFTPEQLTESVIYAHARGRKVYLTMNTLPTNEEADRLPEAIKEAAKAGVDAFIVADLGVLDACKTFAPDIDVHLSTQTGITNWAAARAAYKMGAKRVVLAREMTLQDIAILRDKTPPELEIEAFVHGAMCMSVSGRCLLSNYMAGRDANRGQCAQPCRWKYYLSEETRPGQLYEIGENENGSYILNANDLCTAPFIDLICKAGVDSLKIEGRAKTFYYVASVTAAYRKALDAYLADDLQSTVQSGSITYSKIPWDDWIVDGVEVCNMTEATKHKRLHTDVDAGYVGFSAKAQGHTLHRKLDEAATAAAGFERYVDTNNSSNDFYERETQSLRD